MTGIKVKSSPEKLMKNSAYGKPGYERLTNEFIDKLAQFRVEGHFPGFPPPVREMRKPRTDEFFDDWFIRQDFDGTNDAMAQWDIERPNGISILRHPGELDIERPNGISILPHPGEI